MRQEPARSAAGVEPALPAFPPRPEPLDGVPDLAPEAAEPPVGVLGLVEGFVFSGVHATQNQFTKRAEVHSRIAAEAAWKASRARGEARDPSARAK